MLDEYLLVGIIMLFLKFDVVHLPAQSNTIFMAEFDFFGKKRRAGRMEEALTCFCGNKQLMDT